MSIGNLTSNKAVSLALQGYNPFQPGLGVYCGACQGIVYPNPTTLIAPALSFDPREHTNPITSPYTITNSYAGLGIGNPGIDYKNPGHLLGLLDTFCRMAYGVSMVKSIHDGNDIVGEVSPAVTVALPIKDGDFVASFLGPSDIYPSLTEVPSDWFDFFSVNEDTGRVTPDLRQHVSLVPSSRYTPSMNTVDAAALYRLFGGKMTWFYLEMIQYFRSAIAELSDASQSLATKTTIPFTLTNSAAFNAFVHEWAGWIPDYDDEYSDYLLVNEGGSYSHKCTVLTPSEALKTLTGSNSYHDGAESNQGEYRSLTELNSVINIVPVQTAFASFFTESKTPTYIDGDGPYYGDISLRNFFFYSFMISDVLVHISDSNETPGTVSVVGTVTVKNAVPDPSPYETYATWRDDDSHGSSLEGADGDTETDYFVPNQSCQKSVNVRIDLSNSTSWDRSWLDAPYYNEGDIVSDSLESLIGPEPDTSDLVVPINKEFNLSPGCTTLRMRFYIRNRHLVVPDPDETTYLWPTYWVEYSEFVPEQGGGPFPVIPEHLWYPAGTIECGYSNDPDTMQGIADSPTIIISLTINGSNIDPIVHEMSA